MKNTAILSFLLSLLLVSCGDDSGSSVNDLSEEAETFSIANKTFFGVAQKGPFTKGSTVSVYELDEKFKQTGINYEKEIDNNQSEYSVKIKKLKSQYALLKANGQYLNEITNTLSKNKITLYALTDFDNRDEANVNILTHLAHKREIYLINEKKLAFKKAKEQAEAEVLKTFGINEKFDAFEDLNIFEKKDQSAALLGISVLMLSQLPETDFEKRLTDFTNDIEKDGVWNNEKTITQIADWAYEHRSDSIFIFDDLKEKNDSILEIIRGNIEKWKISKDIPAFEKYVKNFWLQNYGLGKCTDKQKNKALKNKNSASKYAKEVFICKSNTWYIATDKEKFTYYLPDSLNNSKGKDGEIQRGNIDSTNCYVYDEKKWRKGNELNCTLGLGGCTKQRQKEIGIGSDSIWYLCDNQEWRAWKTVDISPKDTSWKFAIQNEKDTSGWKDTTEGAIRKGKKTDIIYIFDKGIWRLATVPEATLGGCTKEIEDSVGYAEMRKGQDFIDRIAIDCQHKQSDRCKVINRDDYKYSLEGYDYYYSDPYSKHYNHHSIICPAALYHSGYYRCHNEKWHFTNECFIELKKLNATKTGKDGDSQWGTTCPSECYVYENDSNDSIQGKWRFGSLRECLLGLGGCTQSRLGSGRQSAPYTGGYSNVCRKCVSDDDCSGCVCFSTLSFSDFNTTYLCRIDENSPNPHQWAL